MLNTIINRLSRFLSIFGGFSSPEDIRRAQQRNSVAGTRERKGANAEGPAPDEPRMGTRRDDQA